MAPEGCTNQCGRRPQKSAGDRLEVTRKTGSERFYLERLGRHHRHAKLEKRALSAVSIGDILGLLPALDPSVGLLERVDGGSGHPGTLWHILLVLLLPDWAIGLASTVSGKRPC